MMKHDIKFDFPVKDLFSGYRNDVIQGVYAYDGKLEVRPDFQREFIYTEIQQQSVINTILTDGPLNLMYWAKIGDNYACLDGQQRIISICEFLSNHFHVEYQGKLHNFVSLPEEAKQKILNYKLWIDFLDGTRDEYKFWFDKINTKPALLTNQEKLNATYSCVGVTKLRQFLSKPNSQYVSHCKPYMTGEPLRQDYLETALRWYSCELSTKQQDYATNIEKCMADIVNRPELADEISQYVKNVINWVEKVFPNYRKEMKGVQWGFLYKLYKDNEYDPVEMEQKIQTLMADSEITADKGVYLYLLLGDAKYLNKREFDDPTKRKVYERQKGICPECGQHFDIEQMEGHHIVPWVSGGKTVIENCQMLCKKCHSKKNA